MGENAQSNKDKNNIRNSTCETILYIEHLCFHIREGDGKWKVNIYGQKKYILFLFFGFLSVFLFVVFFSFSFFCFCFFVAVVFNLVFT